MNNNKESLWFESKPKIQKINDADKLDKFEKLN